MSYDPPVWNEVDFDFVAARTYTVRFSSFQFGANEDADMLFHRGADHGGVGTPLFTWRQYIEPPGSQVSLSGDTSVYPGFLWSFDFTDAYTPPTYDAVSFVFGGLPGEIFPAGINAVGYGEPNVAHSTRYVGAAGIEPGAFGSSTVYNLAQYVLPSGPSLGAQGTPAIANVNRYLLPSGPSTAAYGSATVQNSQRFLTVNGLAAGAFGQPAIIGPQWIIPVALNAFKGFGFAADGTGFVAFSRRVLYPSGPSTAAYGTAIFSQEHRTIDLAGRSIVGAVGTPAIGYKIRFLYPSFIFGFGAGTPQVDRTHFVEPTGIDELAFGIAEVHDTRQFITNDGADVAEYGTAWVSRSPRVLYPEGFPTTFEGWPSTRWGTHQVWNLTKYVFHYNDAIPGEGGAFGDPIKILVENRDRTIGAIGHRDSKFSSLATVLNDDYAVVPEGLDATLWGSNLVADRIRSLYPEPLEATVVSIHNEVHNDARLLSPAGFGGEVLGTPHTENTRRYFDFWGWDSLSFGTAFAAPAIRTVAVGMGPESDFGIHDAQLATRYLSPPGIDPLPQFGAHDFFERFNIIYPTGPRLTRYGDNGRVYNVTPEVAPFGADLSLWGAPAVRLQYRFILPDGHPATLFGRAAVADRRLYIRPVGPGVLGVGFEHEVRNLIADPPAEQKIKPTSFWGTLWGTAEVRRNEIHPDGLAATLWGSGQVRMMGCYPAGIPPLSGQVPSPWVRGPRYLPAEAIKAPDDPENGLGVTKHAIWPYTIYCTFDVTDQAIRNNGGEFWHLMDTQVFGPEHPERPVFGDALVALAQRSIAPSGADVSRMDGVPGVENRRRYLQVTGTKMTRFGIPTIPFPRTLKPLPIAPPVELYSFSKVENQHRYVAPSAISVYLPVSEGARVEHFNRTISVSGFDAFSSAGHRVHPPEPLIPVGFDATKWGSTWASNRVRTVEPQGFDSFDSSHTPGRFAERMRVTRRGSSVAPKGWHHMRVGSPSIGRPQPERQDIFIEA